MSKNPRPKPQDIVRMRQWRRKGIPLVDIAGFFGIHVNVVSRIVNYKTHKLVTEDALQVPPLLKKEDRIARKEAIMRRLSGGR